ncbi:MAG: hypothetical protein IPI35_06885 [Deltaproteobacteria bacterium]|nr:hypothetical protein [Deltaproteobacteria bacterium]
MAKAISAERRQEAVTAYITRKAQDPSVTYESIAATIRRAVPRARITTLARDLTEALGQLAQAASQRPVNEDDLLPLRSVFARLDGLPQALSGAREPLGVALTEIEGDR